MNAKIIKVIEVENDGSLQHFREDGQELKSTEKEKFIGDYASLIVKLQETERKLNLLIDAIETNTTQIAESRKPNYLRGKLYTIRNLANKIRSQV